MLTEVKLANTLDKRTTYDVIVIGSGPVGVRVVQELSKQNPNQHIAIFGDEPWHPYNRVKLSSLISGDIKQETLYTETNFSENSFVNTFYNNRIIDINRYANQVIDSAGKQHHYEKLIIATGSSPRIPSIDGICKKNIFTFRDLSDAQTLMGRSICTRKTVVIGGGLLGLEAARAMQRFNTEVTVIEHNMWLMFNQLDNHAASYLRKHIENLNINIRTNSNVKKIIGDQLVEGIQLSNGEIIKCDTIIISAGISPNTELARRAGLSIGRGIRVNDYLQTNDQNIFAIGECAEHRNKIYGLIAPGYEQATIVSHNLSRKKALYTGSIISSNLKVIDYPVFSIGNTGDQARSREIFTYHDAKNGIYRKIIVINGRIHGAMAIGEMPGLNRLQEAVINERKLWPWQIRRFTNQGSLWPENASEHVYEWPANAVVCNCTGVTCGRLQAAHRSGATTLAELSLQTGAASVCGSCKPLLANFLGSTIATEPVPAYRSILSISLLSILLLAIFSLTQLNYQSSIQGINWDLIWRDNLFKQITGYSLVFISILITSLSLKKRLPKSITKWDFSYWRIMHIFTSIVIILLLLAHTGFRSGSNLNLYLMAIFSALLLTGAISGIGISCSHILSAKLSRILQQYSIWSHILLLWPLPALLGFHIFKTYYF